MDGKGLVPGACGRDKRLNVAGLALLGISSLVLAQCSSPPADQPAAPASSRSATTSAPAPAGGATSSAPGVPGSTGSSGSSAPVLPASTTTSSQPSPTTATSPAPDPADTAKNAAYEQAYRAKCQAIFSISPTGVLTDADDPSSTYTVKDCLSDLTVSGDFYSTVAEAAQAGTDDAVTAAQSLAGELCYQARCWDGN